VSPTAAALSGKHAPKPAAWAHTEDYVPESPAGMAARAAAVDLGLVPPSRGAAQTLTFLARVVSAKAVVEIGTGAGVASLALLQGMHPDGILTTIDAEAEYQNVARRIIIGTGIRAQRLRTIAGSALTVLPKLSDGAYDLVFVDADKVEYAEYVEQGLRLLRHGGVLAVDNALWHDRSADPANTDEDTEAIRSALTAVQENEDLIASLLPVGDGLLVAVKL
jgi:predicted O-methyltransferase YrrM